MKNLTFPATNPIVAGVLIGKKRPAVDTLIVATASVHKMTLVTRNVDDMVGMGVPVLNPFA